MASRTARTSSTIGSRGSMLFLHQFPGCTEHRGIVACATAKALDFSAHPRVGNVRAVPSQQEVDAVHRGDRDVERVGPRFGGKAPGRNEMAAERNRLCRYVENRRLPQRDQPPCRRIRVARASLIENELRHVEVEGLAAVPPLDGYLLLGRADEIASWPRRQVADDGGFDVGSRLHLR